MAITMNDIAKRCNVSIATVSKVINQSAVGVSAATRERIQRCIDETGYIPNSLARGLVTKKTRTVGLLIPQISNPFFPELVRGIEDEASTCDYGIFLCHTSDSAEKEARYLQLLAERNVDGIIVMTGFHSMSDTRARIVDTNKLPVVMLERRDGVFDYPTVLCDSKEGGKLAARHFFENGHTQIACITGRLNFTSGFDRVQGFIEELQSHGLELPPEYRFKGSYRFEDGAAAIDDFQQNGLLSKITAIFACNDMMAAGAYSRLFELGLRIPEDISVIGFDDITIARVLYPALTTLRQPTYEMGCAAFRVIRDLIEKRSTCHVSIFTPQLIVRKSTRALS